MLVENQHSVQISFHHTSLKSAELGESQKLPDRVCRRKLCHRNVTRCFVRNQWVFCSLLSVVAGGKLSQVTVVVSLPAENHQSQHGKPKAAINSHFVIEDLWLARGGAGDEVLVEDAEDVGANVSELLFHLSSVIPDHLELLLGAFVLLLLFDTGNYPPGGPPGANNVLVRHGQQVALLHSQLYVQRGHFLHRLNHFCNNKTQQLQWDTQFIKLSKNEHFVA